MSQNDFGDFLKKQRAFKGYTVRQLSEMAEISPSYITNLENGKRGVPSPEVLKRLHGPLGITFQELMVKAGHVKYEDWFYDKVEESENETYGELFYHEMLGFPTKEAYLQEILDARSEINHVLKLKELTLNGHPLTEQDRKRISDMLKALFPEYQ
ncbi:helix-turn-helix domain-containing protein [Paenibacillus sp. YIM B09110]|uniref:helix-turn-helix domain-containing protein n=1 Tax=Paenibacillus sp. YIM B09110 TaxID=3126102 RepID=UPI00301E1F75